MQIHFHAEPAKSLLPPEHRQPRPADTPPPTADSRPSRSRRRAADAAALRPDSGSRAINLIALDPAAITPIVQNQFRNFAERAKSLKAAMPPDLARQASNFIRDTIKKHYNLDIDPDKTYVNLFSWAEALHDGNDGITGWQHLKNDMKASRTLTEFALAGFNDAWRAGTSAQLDLSFGLYTSAADAKTYGASNEVPLLPSDVRKLFGAGEIENHLAQQQESFWSTQALKWRSLAKTEFSALARKAALDGQLTEEGSVDDLLGVAGDAKDLSAVPGVDNKRAGAGEAPGQSAKPSQKKTPKFKADRGGDALASTASGYTKFDQAALVKQQPGGMSAGVAAEALQRMDSKGQSLLPAVKGMKEDLKSAGPAKTEVVDSVRQKQKNPDQIAFKHYDETSSKHYDGDQETSIKALEDDVGQLQPSEVALVKMGIKDQHGKTVEGGPVLVEQRLKGQKYQIFDPDNGVFSYRTGDSSRKALDRYLHTAYKDKGSIYPETLKTYKYQSEPLQGASKPGTSGTGRKDPDAQQPFGNDLDFPYIDADPVPDPSVVKPSAASQHERDLQIQKERELHQIPDPRSPGYRDHLAQLVAKVKGETGVIGSDLIGLQNISYEYNTIIGIRPVDRFATGLIEAGYETKGFHIKGKSASWGPQAGLICADQHFSKLENADPARIDKFNAAIDKSIADRDAVKIALALSPSRLDALAGLGTISALSAPDANGVRSFTAIAPSGKSYRFEATPQHDAGEPLYTITSEHRPIEVLAPTTPNAKPFTADYDLLVVGPHISDLGPQDNLPVPDVAHPVFRDKVDRYKNENGINPNLRGAYDDPKLFYEKEDPELGNASQRIRNLIPVINNALTLEAGTPRAKIVHHNADAGSPATDPAANYPATFVLPFKMGRFDEIAIVHDAKEFAQLVQEAKNHGYHVPLNPLWEDEVKAVRRTDFAQAAHDAAIRA